MKARRLRYGRATRQGRANDRSAHQQAAGMAQHQVQLTNDTAHELPVAADRLQIDPAQSERGADAA